MSKFKSRTLKIPYKKKQILEINNKTNMNQNIIRAHYPYIG